MLPSEVQASRKEAAQKAWDLYFFVHGVPYRHIDSDLFRLALKATQACPTFTPCCRQTLATTRLKARDEDANCAKEALMLSLQRHGFLFTTDGWRNRRRHSYHNYLISTVAGPVFLALVDHTGQDGSGVGIHDELKSVIEHLHPEIRSQIRIGCTDTPSANRKAWRLLEQSFPDQIWMGCMAHEVSLLFKDWARKITCIHDLHHDLKCITIWILNHSDILLLFHMKVKLQWPDNKKRHSITPYMPGDTRMVTTYKLVDRAILLRPVFEALISDPQYERFAQAALKAWLLNTDFLLQ